MPNAVFLIDVLLRGDLRHLVDGVLSRTGAASVIHAGRVIQQVQRTAGHPLPEVVRTAITALGLDIDLLLAERMRHLDAGNRVTSHAASSLDAMLSLVDTYLQEIAAQGTPSLRAFISWVDSLRDASDDNATAPDTPVDVVLMTVHQSKGLEWDAVAVVGMRDGTFPSSQGDRLSVKTDEDHPAVGATAYGSRRNTSKKPTLGWKTRPRCRFRCAPTRISCHDSRTTRPSGAIPWNRSTDWTMRK